MQDILNYGRKSSRRNRSTSVARFAAKPFAQPCPSLALERRSSGLTRSHGSIITTSSSRTVALLSLSQHMSLQVVRGQCILCSRALGDAPCSQSRYTAARALRVTTLHYSVAAPATVPRS